MTEQTVLGKFSHYYTHQVILGLSLLHSIHLLRKQLLQHVIPLVRSAA